MSFDDLPPQASINPEADAYAARALALSRAAAAETRCVMDVAYGPDYWQKLDIYLPKDRSAKGLPVLFFIHGGGWCFGYKEWCGFTAPALVDLPAILVSVSHRLIPHVSYPAPVKDCIAGLKWVYDHIAEHGGDPGRIYVSGHSAGAHITGLIALRRDWLRAAGLPEDVVRAAFPISATFNRRSVNPNVAPDHVPPEGMLEISPESPLAITAGCRTPFLVTWGGRDPERVHWSSRKMVERLEETGCPVEWHVDEEAGHFDTHLDTARTDSFWTGRVRKWLATGA